MYDKDSLIVFKYEYYYEIWLLIGGMYVFLFNKIGVLLKLLIKIFNFNVDVMFEILLKLY